MNGKVTFAFIHFKPPGLQYQCTLGAVIVHYITLNNNWIWILVECILRITIINFKYNDKPRSFLLLQPLYLLDQSPNLIIQKSIVTCPNVFTGWLPIIQVQNRDVYMSYEELNSHINVLVFSRNRRP